MAPLRSAGQALPAGASPGELALLLDSRFRWNDGKSRRWRYGAMVGNIQPSLISMDRDLSSSPSSQEAKSSSENPSMRWLTLSKKGTLLR